MRVKAWLAILVCGCSCSVMRTQGAQTSCLEVSKGWGPAGTVRVRAEEVVSGLEVPWGLAFLPNGDLLITERPGRLRLVRDGALLPEPIATVATWAEGESGLLGLALHPQFAANRLFYLYETVTRGERQVNRVERWRLAPDGLKATPDKVIFDGAPAAQFHDGGRLRFGPDGMLYVSIGDAREPDRAQDPASPNGKVLRLTPEGEVPADNPIAGRAAFLLGVRNSQGFDWLDSTTLVVADHGPTGDTGRSGHDELNVAKGGDNLGWPKSYGCEMKAGMVAPRVSWVTAAPPGGLAIYRGTAIPEWTGSILIGTLGSTHLQRVVLEGASPHRVSKHEVYFQDELGRIREVIAGPDGTLYLTTSNCDGRGSCPAKKDRVLRIIKG